MAVNLAFHAVFPYRTLNGARSKCRIRVYEPDALELDDVVVVASERPSSTGNSERGMARPSVLTPKCWQTAGSAPLAFFWGIPPDLSMRELQGAFEAY